ncbi:MAG: SpoIIE family protein phosphatase [Spirochaetaceae bacterium]|jgi:sigma-B regulation protein RsbU (phosphoserine phosphatase)|nr:SpoIIE family protein phosphatase [Spirochaetaceae bacterium]
MSKQRLKTKILSTMLITTLSFVVIFSAIFVFVLTKVNNIAAENANNLSGEAAAVSAGALEAQIKPDTMKLAEDAATIIEENLLRIETVTGLLAADLTSVHTHPESYKPRKLPYIAPGKTPPEKGIPYVHAVPGVNVNLLRSDIELAAVCADTLEHAADMMPANISSAFIAGASGYVIIADNVSAPLVEYNIQRRMWYMAAKETEKISWTDVYVDIRGRGVVITCAAPYYAVYAGRKAFKGVVGFDTSVFNIQQIINSTNIWENEGNTYVFLLDKAGRKLFSSNSTSLQVDENGVITSENFLENEQYRAFAEKMVAGESGFFKVVTSSSKSDYVAYHPLSRMKYNLGWSVGIYFDGDGITQQISHLKNEFDGFTLKAQKKTDSIATAMVAAILVLALFIMIIVTVLVFRFADSVTHPIVELGNAIEMVSGGNFNTIQVISSETLELDRLASSFNSMAGRLKTYIRNLALATAERERISSELNVATDIQNTLLPRKFPVLDERNNSFDLYAIMEPAKEVGGDFYDFFFVGEGRLVIVVGDVSGTGLPAALVMVIAKTLIRAYMQQGATLEKALADTNYQICDNNVHNIFVTVWAGLLDFKTGKLQFITAGHNPPFMKSADKKFGLLATATDPPLGFMETSLYHQKQTLFKNGDILFLYTDGLIDSFDKQGRQFEPARLKAVLDENYKLTMRDLVIFVREEVRKFSNSDIRHDDITMLGIRIL